MNLKELVGDSLIRSNAVAESNRALTKELQARHHDRMQESIRRAFGVDMTDKEAFKFDSPFFSWKKFRESAYEISRKAGAMHEANSENTFGQLLRAGINTLANNWYELVETNHELVGATTYSTHAIELHAPLHRGAVPKRVVRGGQFPKTKLRGLDIQILNEKFGAIEDFERELFDDDQTGQISNRAKDIGSNMRILEDAWFFQRFIGSAGTYAGDPIPASQTYTTVWSTALDGGGINKPASYAVLKSEGVQYADITLMAQLDLLGNKMMVNPNTLLVGTKNKFAARTLMNSEWYPANAAMKIGGTGGTASDIGTTFARNVLDGAYNIVVSRFLPATAWALGEAGKGIIFQRRDALEVIQENPMSGMAFTNDVYQFRARARWEPDWIDPRFWFLGNDGSAT
jgi:hypothetical protein